MGVLRARVGGAWVDVPTVGAQGPTGATGAQGPAGAQGATGPTGPGVAVGGTAGQVLSKVDATNYNTQWVTPSAGGTGTVTSISAGAGITVTPSPITGAGSVALTVPVSVANGGTGAITAPLALDSLSGASGTTAGALQRSAGGVWSVSAVGGAVSISAGAGITVTPNPITGTGTVALTVPVAVANGGTGTTSLTQYGVMVGNVSSVTLQLPSTSGTIFASNGSAAMPTFRSLTTLLDTLAGTAAQGQIWYRGAAVWTALSAGTAGQTLHTNGAAGNPAWGLVNLASATEVTGTLPVANGGSGAASLAAGPWVTRSGDTMTGTLAAPQLTANRGDTNNTLIQISNVSRAWQLVTRTDSAFGIIDASVPAWRMTIDTAGLAQFYGSLAVLNGQSVFMDSSAGQGSSIQSRRGGNNRWSFSLNNSAAETGGNAGSNFQIDRFSDAGTYIDSPISIVRATGAITCASGLLQITQPAATDATVLLQNSAHAWKLIAHSSADFWIYDTTRSVIGLIVNNTAAACYNQSGTWTALSSRSVKEDIAPYTRGLEAVLQLEPVSFRYMAGTPFVGQDEVGRPRVGLIAEEVEPVVPEVLVESELPVRGETTSLKGINTTDLLYVLINAIKELDAKIKALGGK